MMALVHRLLMKPMITLTSYEEDIEGVVVLSKPFEQVSTLARLDLLKDWIGALSELYDEELEAWGPELELERAEREAYEGS